jgi:hypothetical protein
MKSIGTDSAAAAAVAAAKKGSNRAGIYFGKKKVRDRYEELDSSTAVAVTAGTQPTLAKRRRILANQKSVINDSDVNQIFNDLTLHKDRIKNNATAIFNARKRFWKHKFSGLSTQDFDIIWKEARKQYEDGNITVMNADTGDGDGGNFDASSDGEEEIMGKTEKTNDVQLLSDGDGEEEVEKEKGKEQSTLAMTTKKERPPDRWSKLFIGQTFKGLGCEFTLDEFEECI